MHFVILAIVILAVIGFLVVLWFAAKSWRWFTVSAALVTMALGVALMFPTAVALKSRSEWHKIHESLRDRVADLAAEQQRLKFGDESDRGAGPGVVALSLAMDSIGIETGRRWRDMSLVNVADGAITLESLSVDDSADALPAGDAQAVDGDDPAADPDAQPLIPTEMILYGFSQDDAGLPSSYIGEFRVVDSGPDRVTIQATGTISGRAPKSWALYELLPVDSHAPFIAEGSSASEENLLGRINEELVKRVLGEVQDPRVLQSYLEDGRRVRDEDPKIARWATVQFTAKYEEDVDSPDSRGALDGGFFDSTGRAVDSRLQIGGKVKFEIGDEITLLEEKAQELVDIGVAEIKLDYYLRPLNDYRFALPSIRLKLADLEIRKRELEREIVTSQKALDATIKNTATVQSDRLKLERDLAQTQVETKALTSYRDKLLASLQQTQRRVVSLYRRNAQMAAELEQIQMALKSQVDAVTMTP